MPRDLPDESAAERMQASLCRATGDVANRDTESDLPLRFGPGRGTSQAELAYLLCRSLRARRVIHFGASINGSIQQLAAAMRDNGGGLVICSGTAPENVASGKHDLTDTGLLEYVQILEGGALETLHELDGDIDFAMIEGGCCEGRPSLALQVVRVIAPQMQGGAIVLGNRAEADYLAWIRHPANGFHSMNVSIDRGVELSVKIADDPI